MAAREPTPDAFGVDFSRDSSTLSAEDLSGNNAEWPLARFTSYKAEILDDLGFEKFLQQNTVSVTVNFDSGRIQGSKEGIQNAIKKFEMEIYTDLIKFKDMPGISRLVCDKDGLIIEQIEGYIKKVLFEKKITNFHLKCYCNITNDDMLSALVYCRSRDEVVKAKTLIETHICSFSPLNLSSGVKKVISEWQQRHKLVQTEGENGEVIITCTLDVREKIEAETQKKNIKTFEMSSLRAKYLDKHSEIIALASKNFGVEIELDPDRCSIQLEGPHKNIKLAMNNIKSKLNSETVSVSTFPSKSLVSELDRIAEEQDCVWEIKKDNPSTHIPGEIENCDYVATWYDPTKPGMFTVIEGDTQDINVDCLIVLCTDNLYPLQFYPDAETIARMKAEMETTNESFDLGFMKLQASDARRYSKEAYIVVGKSNTSKNANKTFHDLSSCFITHLRTIAEEEIKTVCLSAYIHEEFLSTDIVVTAYVEAAVEMQMYGHPLNIYLYFEREKKLLNDRMLETIQRLYSKKPGFSRTVLQEKSEMKELNRPNLKAEIEIASIETMRTEIIVNTTSNKLELNKGIVSSKLLQLAGEQMQRHCNMVYPGGIDYTTIAVTDSFGLKHVNKYLNYVFHGALPVFRWGTYIKDIKTFIRCCLAEADKRECKSIAFPALGTGKLCYPVRQVAKAMFDAVKEYSQEAVCPYVERVVFSLYHGDKNICEVFRREEQERLVDNMDTGRNYRDNSSAIRHIKGTIQGYWHPVEIMVGIGTTEDLPHTCVIIKVCPGDDPICELKYSSESPKTVHDQLIVCGGKEKKQTVNFLPRGTEDEQSYRKALKIAIQHCIDNNIAEIAIDLSAGPQSIDGETKLTSISTSVEKCLPTQSMTQYGFFVLHTIHVRVSSSSQFEAFEKKFKGRVQTVKNFVNTVKPLGSNIKWEIIDSMPQDSAVKIQVIGKTEESVQMAKYRIVEAVNVGSRSARDNRQNVSGTDVDNTWYNTHMGARPKFDERHLSSDSSGSLSDDSVDRSMTQNSVVNSTDGNNYGELHEISGRNIQNDESYWVDDTNNDMDEKIKDIHISAEVNVGFIIFKEKYNDLRRWRKLVEEVYNIKLDEEMKSDEESVYKVQGKYQQVMDFRFYLDHKFPLDPKPIHRRQKDTKPELKESTVRRTEQPVPEQQAVKDEAYLHQVEDHFGSNDSLLLPGKELESLLFMKIASGDTDNSVRMKYADRQGLVIEFGGSKSRLRMLQEKHKDFKRDVCNTHIILRDQNESLIAQNAVQNILDDNDNVLVRYVPEDDTIYIVGINKASSEEARIKILEYLGQRIETEQPSDMKNVDPAVKRKQKEESVNGSREYSKRHHTESEQRLVKNGLPSRSGEIGVENSDTNVPQLPPRGIGSHKINKERQEEQGKMNHLYVKIDRCEITDIKADYLVIPFSKQGHPLSERVYSALGDDVRRELNHSMNTFGRLSSCECRRTGAGILKGCKVVHMCLDEDRKSDVTGDLLERALTNALWIAKDGPIVAVLLTGLYDSKISVHHAEQFFDAIVSFSKSTTTEITATCREVHLLSHNGEHVGVAKQTFERMAVKIGVKTKEDWFLFQRTPIAEISHKAKSVELNVERVKLFIGKGDVAEVFADGIVCIQDIDLSCSGETACKVYELCGDGYRQSIEKSRQKKMYHNDILALETKGGSITAKYVINVFVSELNDGHYESFATMLGQTVTKILQRSEELKLTSLAMPFLQPGEEDKQADINLIKACCKGMYSAITRYFKNRRQSCLKRLDILVKDEGILEEMKKTFQVTVTDIW